MRYYSIDQVREGMILGQELHDASGKMLLAKYTRLTAENVSFIAFLGIQGVYVDDHFSREVEIREVVRPEVRKASVRVVQNIFNQAAGEETPAGEPDLRESVEDIVGAVLDNDNVMYSLVEMRSYDDYTYFHSANVAILAGILGAKAGLSQEALNNLVTAGFLHDIGKIFVNPDIINAPRQLTEEERIDMMDHPRRGYEFLVGNYDFPEEVLQAVYEHHEWHNGTGYPRRLKGEQISPLARILKVADVYDAMTSRRSYHDPYLPSDVVEYIMGRSGMEFDPGTVKIMAEELPVYPVGCEVELSDGRRAIVAENHRGYVLRPTVKLLEGGSLLNLLDDPDTRNLTITRLMM